MSSFLQHKLDIYKVIPLITSKVLRFLPYFILLLSKIHLNYTFYLFRMNINNVFFLFSKPNKHKHFKNKLKIIVKKYCSY